MSQKEQKAELAIQKESNRKLQEEVELKKQPLGGFTAVPSIQGGGVYLATYMYIFYEYDGEQFTYKKMQIRPDKGGIAAESYPQSFIWDTNTKTFEKK